MGNAVKVTFQLNVVIDMYPGLLPLGIFVRSYRESQHSWQINLLKPALPAAGQFSERTVVQKDKTFPDGGIGLSQAEEGPVTKACQDEALGNQHTTFDFGLILGVPDTCRNDSGAVMIGEFGIGGIYIRLIAAGLVDGGEQIVGNKAMGDCA